MVKEIDILKGYKKYWFFMMDLLKFVDENKVAFHPAQDIIKKIQTMDQNNRTCICKSERICPCKESVEELRIEGRCTCMLFSTYKYGDEYLNKYGYLKDGKVTTDSERKYIVKEKERVKLIMQPQKK